MKAMTPTPPRPGQGHKYILITQILGEEPDQWIAARRQADPDTGRKPSYAEIAEEMNALIASRYDGPRPIRVTHESVRRWDPSGAYQWTGDDLGEEPGVQEEPPPPPARPQPPTELIPDPSVPPPMFIEPADHAARERSA